MGGVFHAVGSLFKGVTNTVGSLLGGGQQSAPTVNVATPEVQNAAVSQAAPEVAPTEENATNTLNRKRKGKASLTIPTTGGAGSGGTGLNV